MKFKAIGTGRLGKNADVTPFENGRSVIEFSVAANSFYKNKEGEKVQDTEWHDIKVFVKDVNQKFVDRLAKGAEVTVAGTLESSTSKEGKSFPYIRANASDIKVHGISQSEAEEAAETESDENASTDENETKS